MKERLLSVGEFAKLARTTKRTVTFYDEKDILKPKSVDSKGFRSYSSKQIIDFQIILFLKKLNFSLEEIRFYIHKKASLKSLFNIKKESIKQEIIDLQRSLNSIENYYQNLDKTNTLIAPKIKAVKDFEIYYILKQGSYSNIKEYCLELKSYFKVIPQNTTFLTIFEDTEYKPKSSLMKIGVILEDSMVLDENIKVTRERIKSYKAITYTHHGSGKLLSLLWKALSKYRKDHNIKVDTDLYDREFYYLTSLNGEENEDNHIFEIQIPIID